MKRTVELNDTLQDRVDSAIADVKTELENYLKENPDTEETPDLGNDPDYSGAIHQIVDGSVPIYTHEIKTAMFLHGTEIEQAFDDAGLGSRDDDWPMGWEAAAIYCYIEQQVNKWYHDNADDIFEAWKEARDASAKETEQ